MFNKNRKTEKLIGIVLLILLASSVLTIFANIGVETASAQTTNTIPSNLLQYTFPQASADPSHSYYSAGPWANLTAH